MALVVYPCLVCKHVSTPQTDHHTTADSMTIDFKMQSSGADNITGKNVLALRGTSCL